MVRRTALEMDALPMTPPRPPDWPALPPDTGLIAQLRALRLERGLPLKVVAHELGVSLWWLCQLEHGHGRATAKLERWARALGAEVVVAIPTNTAHPKPPRRR